MLTISLTLLVEIKDLRVQLLIEHATLYIEGHVKLLQAFNSDI